VCRAASMKLLDFQLVSLFTLLGVSLVGVAVPFYFGPGPRGEYLLSLGNAFAGTSGSGKVASSTVAQSVSGTARMPGVSSHLSVSPWQAV